MRKLFSANPARIGRFECAPVADAVPDHIALGTPKELKADLIALLGKDKPWTEYAESERPLRDAIAKFTKPPRAA